MPTAVIRNGPASTGEARGAAANVEESSTSGSSGPDSWTRQGRLAGTAAVQAVTPSQPSVVRAR